MSRRRKKRRSGTEGFVMLTYWMLDSPAWGSLSTAERAVYVALARRYNGSNNGRIGLSTRDAATLCRISKDTATKAFRTLVARGFIELRRAGTFHRHDRLAAEWRLTAYNCDISGELPTKAFQSWGRERPKPPPTTPGPGIVDSLKASESPRGKA